LANKRDYYEVLGIDKNATDDDIKRAFRRKAKECHPDLHPDDKEAEARFKELNAANAAERELLDEGPEEPPVVAASRLGDLWVLGEHRLLCGDSTKLVDVHRIMAGTKAALVATDPSDARTGPAEGACAPLICNLGTSAGFSVREVLAAAERVTGISVPRTVGPRRAGDPPVLVASNARARSVLGWEPRRSSLDEMIGSAWAWRRAHPEGYAD
jgi:hypothetical protein